MAQDVDNSTTTTKKLTAEGATSTEMLSVALSDALPDPLVISAQRQRLDALSVRLVAVEAKFKAELKQLQEPSLRQLAADTAIRKLSTGKVFHQFAVNSDWKELIEQNNQQAEQNQKQAEADREYIDDVISGRALARELGRGVRDLAERGNAASIAPAAITTGDFVATDTADSAAFIAEAAITTGDFVATDTADSAAFIAEAIVAGDLAAIERADGASFVAVETGHATAERLRLITARREETKQLRDRGLSTRQIAKQIGVSQSQVQRDLNHKGSKSEPERLTKAEKRAACDPPASIDPLELITDSIQPQETDSTAEFGDPFRTGLPGRLNYSHLIEIEAKRRIADKEVVPTPKGLAQFARDLENWWEEKRQTFKPPAPPIKAGSIENVVRDIWRKAITNPIK